ncbi:flagellar biosynthetic protein FliR [Planktotalea arctica]|uniref:flagellar biosynthetic protein FliR n=1 Tax=Planktotalea arctica TaxID=1481893 RepID=UPI000A16CFED|nr:flagellar biosynthetic protein FliR [Planktotalea arctica]
MIAQTPSLDSLFGMGGIELQQIFDLALLFFLHTIRLSAFFLSAPFFGAAAITVQIRIMVSVLISASLFGLIEVPNPQTLPFLSLVEVIFVEMAIGLSMGLILSVMFSSVALAGEKIAASAGLGFAAQVDPNLGGQTPVVSQILNLFAITVFLSLDGHLQCIALIRMSYELLPLGQLLDFSTFISAGLNAAGHMFSLASLLSLPVVAILLLANVTVGVVTRSAPQLNLFSFGFPLTILACFFALYFVTTPLGYAIRDFLNFVLQFLEATLLEVG